MRSRNPTLSTVGSAISLIVVGSSGAVIFVKLRDTFKVLSTAGEFRWVNCLRGQFAPPSGTRQQCPGT
jgi:hypothetical protein